MVGFFCSALSRAPARKREVVSAMTRIGTIKNLFCRFVRPLELLFVSCALLFISACANQNYRKAEDLYEGGRYSEAYIYIEQALKDNPENDEYLKLETTIRRGMYRRNFLGLQ
jgi:hypothetical protein